MFQPDSVFGAGVRHPTDGTPNPSLPGGLRAIQFLPQSSNSTSVKRNRTTKSNGRSDSSSPVQLQFTHPTAATVCIAGTFNDWRPEVTPMIPLGHGRWVKLLALPPGVYEYRLVADGEWFPDPLAGETAPNPFGGFNSVLKVDGLSKK